MTGVALVTESMVVRAAARGFGAANRLRGIATAVEVFTTVSEATAWLRELQCGEVLHARFGVAGLPGLIEVQGPVVNVSPLEYGAFRVGAQYWTTLQQRTFGEEVLATSASSLRAHHFRQLRHLPSSRWASD